MEIVYKRYKNKVITHNNYTATCCGYTDSNLILATTDRPNCCFRKVDKSMYIQDDFRDVKFKYVFEDEQEFLKQHSEI
jgi:hypothetical protein